MIMSLIEYLKTLSTEDLMNLSKESEKLNFEESSIIRDMISEYDISSGFYTGLLALKAQLLSEITRRYYENELDVL
jgi:hypothetical protein